MPKPKSDEWVTEDGLLLIEGWAREGLTDEQIARCKIGINVATLYAWQKRFPKIRNALKKGKAPIDTMVENALLKRALGYEVEEEIVEMTDGGKKHMRKVKRHIPPDNVAIIFWLKNRRPDRWRDKPIFSDTQDSEEFSKLIKAIDEGRKQARETGDVQPETNRNL